MKNGKRIFSLLLVFALSLSLLAACTPKPNGPTDSNGQHTHAFGSDWQTDATSHWHACACGEKADLAAHAFGEWTEVKAPTETEDGLQERICTVCAEKESKAIPSLSHTHAFGSDWQTDATSHWHVCACGEKADAAAHAFGEWADVKAPTETEEGLQERICTVCAEKESKTVPSLSHTHAFGSDWQSNATSHWHACACGEKADAAAHTFGAWADVKAPTDTATGLRERTCSACAWKETETIPALHAHAFGSDWQSDATSHWHACACGEKNGMAAHTFGPWTVTKPATENSLGEQERVCTVCAYKETTEAGEIELPPVPLSVRTEGSTDKFLQEYAFRHDPAAVLDIKLAKNEAEAGQILLRSDEKNFAVKNVTVSSLRLNGGSATIPASDILVYRQHYMYVDVHYITANGQYADAAYPDALIEMKYDLAHHKNGLAVEKGKTQGYWITVKTKAGTPAGTYTGKATVSTTLGDVEVPVNVTVWNFTIPEESNFKTAYALYNLNDYAGQWTQYYDYLTSYRLSPMYPALNEGDHNVSTTYSMADYDAAFARAQKDPSVTTQFFNLNYRRSWQQIWMHDCGTYYVCPDKTNPVFPTNHVCTGCSKTMTESDSELQERNVFFDNFKAIYAAAQKALPGKIYAMTHDEPSWQLGDRWVRDVQRFNSDVQKELPGIESLVTLDAPLPLLGTEEGDTLRYLPNVWCIKPSNYVNGDVKDLHAHGQELWFYTCNWPIYPTFNTHIDSYQTAPRVLHWLEYDLGIDGYFCYSAATDRRATTASFPDDNIWVNPYAHLKGDSTGNDAASDPAGDNYIILQGRKGDGVIDENVPVPTIRLEALRDGMEDYEYLYLYEAKIQKILASLKVNHVEARDIMQMLYDALYWDVSDFTRDGERVLYVRERLAAMILEDVNFLYTVERGGNERTLTVYAAPGSTVTVDGKAVSGSNGKYTTTVKLKEGDVNTFTVTVNGKSVTAFAFAKLAGRSHDLVDLRKVNAINSASKPEVSVKDGKLTLALTKENNTLILPNAALTEPGVYNPYTYLRLNLSVSGNAKISSVRLMVRGKSLLGRTMTKNCTVNNPDLSKDIELRLSPQQLEILQMGGVQLELRFDVSANTTVTVNTLTLTDNRTQVQADRDHAGVAEKAVIPQP